MQQLFYEDWSRIVPPSLRVRSCPPPFQFRKTDALTGRSLSGAVFTLYQEEHPLYTACSEQFGVVRFPGLWPGRYTLRETAPPPGYQGNPQTCAVLAGSEGCVQIEGIAASDFRSAGQPLFFAPASFGVFKQDTCSGSRLSGAVLRLTQKGREVSVRQTDAEGLALFEGVASGSYLLSELRPPAGYRRNFTQYQIEVPADGSVRIDGRIKAWTAVEAVPIHWAFPVHSFDALAGGCL